MVVLPRYFGTRCLVDVHLLVAIALSRAGCKAPLNEVAAIHFAMDAFGHLKAIGDSDAAKPLLEKAGVVPDEGATGLDNKFVAAASKRFLRLRALAAHARLRSNPASTFQRPDTGLQRQAAVSERLPLEPATRQANVQNWALS